LENRRWYFRASDINTWREQVLAAAPALGNGLPRIEPVVFLPFFEEDLGGGYCAIDLTAFSWNRGRQSGHLLDPVGVTAQGQRVKRDPAAEVLANLKKGSERDEQIRRIAHPALRKRLQADPNRAAENLVLWLQASVQAGLVNGGMGNHPGDQAGKRLLEEFVTQPVESFLTEDKDLQRGIPRGIGVRCLIAGAAGSFDVARCDEEGRVFQHYKADPHWRCLCVGYRERNGALDRRRPELLWVNQVRAVSRGASGSQVPLDVPDDSPLRGRPLGGRGSLKAFLTEWQQAFDALCHADGIVKVFRITQGCVIEKTDGTCFQLRNFMREQPWMKRSPFRDIRRVYRSPVRFWRACANSAAPPE
jgi:hypothetical protein